MINIRICLLVLLLAVSFAYGHGLKGKEGKKCNYIPPGEFGKIDTRLPDEPANDAERSLYGANPIRFGYDSSQLSSMTATQKTNVINAVETAFNFFANFVSVVNPVTQSFSISTCSSYSFSSTQKSKKWSGIDMVFYLEVQSATDNWIAGATACQLQNVDGRPVAGMIQFNKNYLESSYNYYSFQALIEVVTHEIFHALALSPDLFPYYKNQGYTSGTHYKTGSNPWVAFPNVLAWAKAHYGCTTLTSVSLEDDGGDGSAGAHWERTQLQNDLMTSSNLVGDGIWSGINNALMVDSNWYTVDTSFAETMYWGKNKGCDFLSKECVQSTLPEEFCDSSTTNLGGFYNSGYGQCSNSDPFLDNSCSYVQTYTNTVCYNPQNQNESAVKPLVNAGSKFGWNSKAIQSTLIPTGSSFASPFNTSKLSQCYPVSCSGSTVTITVGSNTVTCSTDGASKTLSGYSGALTCPTSTTFCQRMYNCNNMCNSGGFCMKKQCYCTTGFSGPDCICGNGTYYKSSTSSCVNCSMTNCGKCNTSDVCSACKVGYAFNSSGTSCIETFDSVTSSTKIIFGIIAISIFALL